jgi:hypothetical protein
MHIRHIKKHSKFGVYEYPKNQMEFENMFSTEKQFLAYLKQLRFPQGY